VDQIELDGRFWQSAEDFYLAYLCAVGAPTWHGHNLDALWDSLTGGDINGRNPPLRIRIVGLDQMRKDSREMVQRFAGLVNEAKAQGQQVEIELA